MASSFEVLVDVGSSKQKATFTSISGIRRFRHQQEHEQEHEQHQYEYECEYECERE